MTITSFNPLIVTKDAEATIALFEALGFERRHMKTGINDKDITSVRMRYTGEDGKVFHVDVTQAPVPQDIASIRMNVRDFDEAYQLLEERGLMCCCNVASPEGTTSSKAVSMSINNFIYGGIKPSGL